MRITRPDISPAMYRTARHVGAGTGAAVMGYLGVALGWMERERWAWRYARQHTDPVYPPSQRPRAASTAGRRPGD